MLQETPSRFFLLETHVSIKVLINAMILHTLDFTSPAVNALFESIWLSNNAEN